MANSRLLSAVVSVSILLAGCAGNIKIKIDPSNPVYQPKNEFERDYGFFITPDERKVGYVIEVYPKLSEPIKPFDQIDTLDEFHKFEKHFWDIRDTDPNTPQNEYKELIDSRLQNIKNEIFTTDMDIPGTRFDRNGGLKGDLAHVYLLWGAPAPRNKAKLAEGHYHVELVAWYYVDATGRHLMRYLFYESGGKWQLFKDPFPVHSLEDLLSPAFSPLKKISKGLAISTVEEMWELWQELERDDPGGVFRTPMFEFSDYTHIDKNTRWTIDKALSPPEPALLTARRFKPTIAGQPGDLSNKELLNNPYNSFIPADLEITKNDHPSFSLSIGYSNVDWEVKEKNTESVLDIRISFQHKESRKIKEFLARIKTPPKSREEVEEKRKGVLVGNVVAPVVMKMNLDNVYNFVHPEQTPQTLHQMINDLEPGDYVVNVDLRHAVTKKYNSWREEITIK